MNELSLTQLEEGKAATVAALHGGCSFERRLRSVGIKEGKPVRMVARHPFAGPVVVEVDGRRITIGRGMAQRIAVALQKQ